MRLRRGFFLDDTLKHSDGTRQVSVGQLLTYEVVFENYGEKSLDFSLQLYDRISDKWKPLLLEESGLNYNSASTLNSLSSAIAPPKMMSIEPRQKTKLNFSYYVSENGIHTLVCFLKAENTGTDVIPASLCSFEAILFLIVKTSFLAELSSNEFLFSLSILNVSQYVVLIRQVYFNYDGYEASSVTCEEDTASASVVSCSLSQNGKLQHLYKLTRLKARRLGSGGSKGVVKVTWNTNFFPPVTLGIAHTHGIDDKCRTPNVEFRVHSEVLSVSDSSSTTPSIILQLLILNNSPHETLKGVNIAVSTPRRSGLIIPSHSKSISLENIGPNGAAEPCVEVIPLHPGVLDIVKLILRFSKGGESSAPDIIIHKIHY